MQNTKRLERLLCNVLITGQWSPMFGWSSSSSQTWGLWPVMVTCPLFSGLLFLLGFYVFILRYIQAWVFIISIYPVNICMKLEKMVESGDREAASSVVGLKGLWWLIWKSDNFYFEPAFRYILDNPQLMQGRRVLDVGSGSGACAIAAMKSGALNATANDIDPGILKPIQNMFHLQSEITVSFFVQPYSSVTMTEY